MSQPISPQSVNYFHGKITREQAEELLLSKGGTEGLFLLRESVNGNFAVSLCYNQRVHHYNIERQADGTYQIPTGRRFIGPVELVRHHSQHLDGFLTLARFPLERYPTGLTYYVLQGVTAADLEERLRLKAVEMGLKGTNSIDEALSGPMREHLKQLVLKDMHHSQPWFHDIIHRSDGESRLTEAGHTEGQYLVRFRKDDNSYVLSISFQGQPKHYKINTSMEKFQIEGGHYFNSLVEMIDHYHFRQDGLLCKLRFPVESPRYQRARSGANSTASRSISGASPKHVFTDYFCSLKNVRAAAVQTPSSLPLASEKSVTPPHPSQAGPRHSLTGCHPHCSPGHTGTTSSTGSTGSTGSSSHCNINATTTVTSHGARSSSLQRPPGTVTSPSDLISFSDGQQNQMNCHINTSMTANCPVGLVSPLNIINTNNIFMNSSGGGVNAVPHSSSTHVFPQQQHQQPPAHIITPLQITQNRLEEACLNFSSGFTPTPTPGNPLAALQFHEQQQQQGQSQQQNPLSVRVTQSLESLHHNPLNSSGPNSGSMMASPMHQQQLQFMGLNQPSIMDEAWEEPDHDHSNSRHDLSGSSSVHASPRQCAATNKTFQPHTLISSPGHQHALTGLPPNTGANWASGSVHNNATCHFMRDLFSETTQVIYDSLPCDDETFNLDPTQISIKEKLGGGNFGHVFGGMYKPQNEVKEVPVAIKMLKQDQVSHVNEDEILMEARVMAQLKHRHIVRLIGVCRDIQVMLILELAPLGPINKYLRKNMDMSVINVTELMYQVALGMAYLEASKFVHRDLAARNVLLVTEKYAKISDFGMSKALKFGNDYYRAANAGKWPIKWYAPECIYYFKFDSKSDVWSYGVTMWECYSYGDRPYRDMKGTQILSMIDRGKRLPKPPNCPDSVYGVMLQCWEFDGVRRPTFAELVLILSRILNNFHTGTSSSGATAQSLPGTRYGSGKSGEGGSY